MDPGTLSYKLYWNYSRSYGYERSKCNSISIWRPTWFTSSELLERAHRVKGWSSNAAVLPSLKFKHVFYFYAYLLCFRLFFNNENLRYLVIDCVHFYWFYNDLGYPEKTFILNLIGCFIRLDRNLLLTCLLTCLCKFVNNKNRNLITTIDCDSDKL